MDLTCCDSILSWRNTACVNEEYSCRQSEIQSNKCQPWNRISDLCRESDCGEPTLYQCLLEEGSSVLWSSGARLVVGGRKRVRDLSLYLSQALGFFAAVCGLWAISPSPLCWSRRKKFCYFRKTPDVRASKTECRKSISFTSSPHTYTYYFKDRLFSLLFGLLPTQICHLACWKWSL